MKRTLEFFLLLLLILFSCRQCAPQVSGLEQVSNPSSVLAFADYLFETGDYSRAIGEYKRFIYLASEKSKTDQAGFRVGVCYEKSGHLENAIDWFSTMLERDSSSESSSAIKYEIGKCYFLGSDYPNAIKVFQDGGTEKSLLMSGWCMLRQANFEEASAYFGKARGIAPGGSPSELPANLARESLEGVRLPRKSPVLAALLSVPVPGAGRAYCGRPGDGLFSFLLVAASYVAANEYYQEDENVAAAGLLAAGLFFHVGDVYGAAISARRYNAVSQGEFIGRIESAHNLHGVLLD